MSQFFILNNNKLTIQEEPPNDIDVLADYCMRLLDSDASEVIISIGDNVSMLRSIHIGALVSAAVRAKQLDKTLKITCNETLAEWLTVLGGYYLHAQNIVETIY
jgi:hypothetical protein